MSTEQNKALVRRWIEEVFVKSNWGLIDELVAPDFVQHDPAPGQAPGAEGLKQVAPGWRRAFPDNWIEIVDMIAEGDKVAFRIHTGGTHQGEFKGIAPTGKRYDITETHIVRVSGGRIAEQWGLEDLLTLMQQLGVVPSPE